MANGGIPNSNGSFVFEINDIDRLRRFLCFGSENGTYYIDSGDSGPGDLGIENTDCIDRLIEAGRGGEIVAELVSFSVEGRAAKQGSLLLTLAMCARLGDRATKTLAYKAVCRICRIPTHLFQFVDLCKTLSVRNGGTGWGRAHSRAIRNWYQKFRGDPLRLAHLVTKYKKRHGWSHKDVLQLAHVKPDSIAVEVVLQYVFKGLEGAVRVCPVAKNAPVDIVMTLNFLKAVEMVRDKPNDVRLVCEAIRSHNLVREHVPLHLHTSTEVWTALLINMPLTAMICNLGKMTSMEMLNADSEAAHLVLKKLRDQRALREARIHPFNVLLAMSIYRQGQGERGSLRWQPNQEIVLALEDAFFMSIKYVEPTGKRFLIAIDVSRSMTSPVTGCDAIKARDAAAALSMVTACREQHCEIVGFSDTLVPIDVNPEMTLPEVIELISRVPEGDTDCAAPIVWAIEENKDFDVFIVCTDSETEIGPAQPAYVLREYRQHSGISRAKLIVCAFASNGFTLADPQDRDMLDMAGFDSNGPAVINTFITAM